MANKTQVQLYHDTLQGVIGERSELQKRVRELEAALGKLVNEAGGSLRGFEPEVRAAIGNTNWECIMLRVRDGAALLLPTPTETKDE